MHLATQLRYPFAKAATGIEEFRDIASVTTALVEQNHHFCANPLRQKPNFGEQSLCLIAEFSQAVPFCMPSAMQPKREALLTKFETVWQQASKNNWRHRFDAGCWS